MRLAARPAWVWLVDRALDGVELGERFTQLVAGDLVVVDQEFVEEGLVEQAALFFVAAPVELLRVFQQGEAEVDQANAVRKVLGRLVQALPQVLTLALDVVELLLDLGVRLGAVGRELDQIVLLSVEPAELVGELLVEEPGGGVFVIEGAGKLGTHRGDELGAELDGGVVRLDRVLDPDDIDVRGGAGPVLGVAAEEVGVLRAAAVDGVLDDHAAGGSGLVAVAAEQRTFQIVVVDAASFAGQRAGLKDVLDAAEQVVVDEGLVTTLDLLALVRDEAEVVAVAQHEPQLVDRDLPGGVQLGGPGAESSVVELVGQVGQGVVASGVQLEGQLHERGTFRVEGDGADLPVVEALEDIEVAQRCPSEGAAVLGLLAHLVRDVGATGFGLVLVNGVEDGLHQGTFGVVAHVDDRGDDAGADLLQVALGDTSVDAVSEDAVEVVDDDVVDVLLCFDPGDHLLERRPLVDVRRGTTRLDKLPYDVGVEGVRLAAAGFPLGRYGDALWVVIGVDLARRGHA